MSRAVLADRRMIPFRLLTSTILERSNRKGYVGPMKRLISLLAIILALATLPTGRVGVIGHGGNVSAQGMGNLVSFSREGLKVPARQPKRKRLWLGDESRAEIDHGGVIVVAIATEMWALPLVLTFQQFTANFGPCKAGADTNLIMIFHFAKAEPDNAEIVFNSIWCDRN